MLTAPRFALSLLMALFLLSTVCAQDQTTTSTQSQSPVLTATATGTHVRYVSLGEVRGMRLEIFNSLGQRVFDSAFHSGNLLDWHLRDQQGQPLIDGSYLFVVTIKDFADQLSQKYGSLTVAQSDVTLQQVEAKQLSVGQAQALAASQQSPQLSVVDRIGVEVPASSTGGSNVVANSENKAVPSNVTPQNSAITPSPQSIAGNFVTGAGTTGRITKWTDGVNSVIGDSILSESGGNLLVNNGSIQMNTPASPTADTNLLFVDDNTRTTGVIASNTPAFLAGNGPYFAMRGNQYTAIANQRGLFSISAGNVSSPVGVEGAILFLTGADKLRMIVKPTGNVGVGTNTPTQLLHVQGGNIYVGSAGQGIVLKSPDGSVCRLLSIDNTGAIALSALPCP